MSRLGQSHRWTPAQRRAASIRMKQAYAKKKAAGQGNLFTGIASSAVQGAPAQQAHFDQQRFGEFQFRRGLVTAMECILRALR